MNTEMIVNGRCSLPKKFMLGSEYTWSVCCKEILWTFSEIP